MDTNTFEQSLKAFARRVPFKLFTVEMVSGATIEVDHPEAMIIRKGIAVFVDAQGIPTLFDHQSVSRLISNADQAASA